MNLLNEHNGQKSANELGVTIFFPNVENLNNLFDQTGPNPFLLT